MLSTRCSDNLCQTQSGLVGANGGSEKTDVEAKDSPQEQVCWKCSNIDKVLSTFTII